MKFFGIFLIRLLIFPVSIFLLTLTGLTVFFLTKGSDYDWAYWKNFNKPLIENLPWSKYK